jgi:hypothetical protein
MPKCASYRCGGAALFAASLDARLHADLARGLAGGGGLLRSVRDCGVAARALGQQGGHGWRGEGQQKGKTAKG